MSHTHTYIYMTLVA